MITKLFLFVVIHVCINLHAHIQTYMHMYTLIQSFFFLRDDLLDLILEFDKGDESPGAFEGRKYRHF